MKAPSAVDAGTTPELSRRISAVYAMTRHHATSPIVRIDSGTKRMTGTTTTRSTVPMIPFPASAPAIPPPPASLSRTPPTFSLTSSHLRAAACFALSILSAAAALPIRSASAAPPPCIPCIPGIPGIPADAVALQ